MVPQNILPLTRSPMHDCVVLVVPCVYVSPGSQQCLHERHVAVHDGQVQRCEAVGVSRVRQRWRRHQHAVCTRGACCLTCARAARRAVVKRAAKSAVSDAD